MTSIDRIHQSFARQAMMATLGAELTLVQTGTVHIRMALRPELGQQQGFAHGALAFAIGDSAAGYSALSLLDLGSEVVTSEMSIHYLAPGKGTHLEARGSVIKPGKRMLVVQADVFAIDTSRDTHIARLTGTMVRVPA